MQSNTFNRQPKNPSIYLDKRTSLSEDKLIKLKWAVEICTVWVGFSTASLERNNI